MYVDHCSVCGGELVYDSYEEMSSDNSCPYCENKRLHERKLRLEDELNYTLKFVKLNEELNMSSKISNFYGV